MVGRLGALTSPGDVAVAVAAAARVQPGPGEPAHQLALALHPRNMLIVLDNCEHLVDPWRVFAACHIARAPRASAASSTFQRRCGFRGTFPLGDAAFRQRTSHRWALPRDNGRSFHLTSSDSQLTTARVRWRPVPTQRRANNHPPDLRAVPMSDALRNLAARGEAKLYAKGRVLIQEGDTGATLFIILSGRLRSFSDNEDSTRRVTYGEYLPGEFLGEMSLDGGPRSASVVAVEPTWCVMVTRATLEPYISECPGFAIELLSKVIRRARAATLSLRAIALNDVYGRLAWLLNGRAVTQPDGTRAVGPMTHLQMAEALGCTRPMVSRVMKELERGGYVVTVERKVLIRKTLPARF